MASSVELPRARDVTVVDLVNARLETWRGTRPRRTRVEQWTNRPATLDGHEFWVASLPFVGVTWTRRGPGYWRRRLTAVVLLAVAATVITVFDVAFARAAASGSTAALVGLLVVLVVLAAATLLYYWRFDLYSPKPVPGTPRWPKPVRIAGSFLGVAGLCLTPVWVLSFLVDLLPRFPATERAAWQLLADQQPDGWGAVAPAVRRRA